MRKKLITCANCEKKIQQDFKFCPHCGQNSNEELSISLLFYNTINNYFSVDARFFKSFFPLVFKPGYLAKKFTEGKRLLYLHPAQMYLFVSVVFFFVFSFVQRDQVKSFDENLAKTLYSENKTDVNSEIKIEDSSAYLQFKINDSLGSRKDDLNDFGFNRKRVDSLIAVGTDDVIILKELGLKGDDGVFKRRLITQALKFYKSRMGGSILQGFYDSIPIAMFLLLPIFALILMLFHRKRGSYVYHLVFSFYYFSFLFVLFLVFLLINFIYDTPDWVFNLLVLLAFLYLIKAVKRFYQQRFFISFIKSSAITFMFFLLVIPMAVITLFTIVFLFY
ncbi:DUF3667 domain-containing protein [Mariniflexile sp.]|uniref:DUF3667 domain-containing protein n=1 Tax=Mariniflexile sp. TaxID=1979402 RepID=UPI00356AF25E